MKLHPWTNIPVCEKRMLLIVPYYRLVCIEHPSRLIAGFHDDIKYVPTSFILDMLFEAVP